MSKKIRTEAVDELFEAVLCLKNREECYSFFEDLCTRKELEKMAERLYAAKLLMQGMTYQQVMAGTDISSATLSLVSRCVQYGTGYSRLIKEDGK